MESSHKLKTYNSRYIENKYKENSLDTKLDKDSELKSSIISNLEEKLKEMVEKLAWPIDTHYTLNSLNEKEYDFSLYVGTGGNCYVFWRLYELCKKRSESKIFTDLLNKAENYFEIAISTNLKTAKIVESKEDFKLSQIPVSFQVGLVGLYTMGCLYYRIKEDENNFKICSREVLKYFDSAFSDKSEDEVLNGTAGYLFALLLIKKHCGDYLKLDEKFSSFDDSILGLINWLHKEGALQRNKFDASCLIWPWPKKKVKKLEDVYIGAAHGLMGVIHMMILALDMINVKLENKSTISDEISAIIEDIRSTLDYLLKIRFESGNFPSRFGSSNDKLVHFCHGGTGAIPLFLSAYKYFKDENYLNCALKAGEDLWNRGLLLKGNSICHGISGGSYSFYSLFKTTNDTKWLNRSLLFASATFDDDIQALCKNTPDPQRLTKGVPDTPYSLMEGQGGVICLISDLLAENVIFPGFEI